MRKIAVFRESLKSISERSIRFSTQIWEYVFSYSLQNQLMAGTIPKSSNMEGRKSDIILRVSSLACWIFEIRSLNSSWFRLPCFFSRNQEHSLQRNIYSMMWYQIFSGKHRFSLLAAARPQCWQKYCAFRIRLLYCSCVMFFTSSQRCRSCPSWGTFSAASERNIFPVSANSITSLRDRVAFSICLKSNYPCLEKRSLLSTTPEINPTHLTAVTPCAIFWSLYLNINIFKNKTLLSFKEDKIVELSSRVERLIDSTS